MSVLLIVRRNVCWPRRMLPSGEYALRALLTLEKLGETDGRQTVTLCLQNFA